MTKVAPAVGDGMPIYMSALALEEELLVEWDDAACLSLPKYLLIFLQNNQTTQLVEWIRKIKSQRLDVQKLVIRGLVIRDCLINFLIKILAKLSPFSSQL